MEIRFYAPEWGNQLPFGDFCKKVKQVGYDGVEMALPFERDERQNILDTLKDHELELVGQYWQSFERDIDLHEANYEKYLWNLIEANPVLINCQTGKDYFGFEENKRLFEKAAALSSSSGIKIIHETHRGKALFAAHITNQYLSQIPSLRLCLDISHWCAVHESLLHDQQHEVERAIVHTDHIHSRIGHPEGPQVNDPRAPEWKETVDAHLIWWDKVVDTHQKNGSVLTVTTEFGPLPYMQSLAYTQTPVANQWEINVYMLNLLKSRYLSKKTGHAKT